MTTTIEDRTLALADKIKTGWELCSFMEQYSCACEMETMICQTISACRRNFKDHGQAFSFDGVRNKTQQIDGTDNGTAYDQLFRHGWFKHGEFEGRKTIVPTEKLVVVLEEFLGRKEA